MGLGLERAQADACTQVGGFAHARHACACAWVASASLRADTAIPCGRRHACMHHAPSVHKEATRQVTEGAPVRLRLAWCSRCRPAPLTGEPCWPAGRAHCCQTCAQSRGRAAPAAAAGAPRTWSGPLLRAQSRRRTPASVGRAQAGRRVGAPPRACGVSHNPCLGRSGCGAGRGRPVMQFRNKYRAGCQVPGWHWQQSAGTGEVHWCRYIGMHATEPMA